MPTTTRHLRPHRRSIEEDGCREVAGPRRVAAWASLPTSTAVLSSRDPGSNATLSKKSTKLVRAVPRSQSCNSMQPSWHLPGLSVCRLPSSSPSWPKHHLLGEPGRRRAMAKRGFLLLVNLAAIDALHYARGNVARVTESAETVIRTKSRSALNNSASRPSRS